MKLLTTINIPKLDGTRVIKNSKLFNWIDSDFEKWQADKPGTPTEAVTLEVLEMDRDATFAQIMSPDNLLTQDQILYFVEHHQNQLRDEGYSTFFPFKSGEEIFVAGVGFGSDGRLNVRVYRFSFDGVWYAGFRHRIVLPQLSPSPLDTKKAIVKERLRAVEILSKYYHETTDLKTADLIEQMQREILQTNL